MIPLLVLIASAAVGAGVQFAILRCWGWNPAAIWLALVLSMVSGFGTYWLLQRIAA